MRVTITNRPLVSEASLEAATGLRLHHARLSRRTGQESPFGSTITNTNGDAGVYLVSPESPMVELRLPELDTVKRVAAWEKPPPLRTVVLRG